MRKVFIDCGAHCGESINRAKRQFGLDTTIISFEAVPALAEELQKLYADDDLVQIVNAAVYVKDDTLNFNLSPAYTDGSSIFKTLNNNHLATTVEVPCFDLSSWIKASFDSNDYLILKLDIEGAEYDVLEKMIEDNTLNMVNELWGEWHYGHIINNLTEQEKQQFINKVVNLNEKLKELNMNMSTWEAYYNPNDKVITRPKSLYE
jgi:FkbM family methyltransferase